MKVYIIEPEDKYCVVEFEHWANKDNPQKIMRKTVWRRAEYSVFVPETDDEILDWWEAITTEKYDSVEELLKENDLETLEELFEDHPFLPDPEENYVDMTCYWHAMNSTTEALEEEWSSRDEDLLAEIEAVKDNYEENYGNDTWPQHPTDRLEELGYDPVYIDVEIYCPVTVDLVTDPELRECCIHNMP